MARRAPGLGSDLRWGDVAERLARWWPRFKRDLPWRAARDSYAVLVAEVLLRRTNASKVVGTYLALMERYPTPRELAKASERELAELLRPLGLHRTRARQLRAMARELLERHGGTVPRDVSELRRLTGVGDYAASAVACFAYGEPVPAVDGNVLRVLSRLMGRSDLSADEARSAMAELISCGRPDELTYAVLDLAAQVCSARRPKCAECPLADLCATAQQRFSGRWAQVRACRRLSSDSTRTATSRVSST